MEVKQGELKKLAIELGKEIGELLEKKNADYGGASFSLGIKGVYVHLFDKMKRIENMAWIGNESNYEGLEDSLKDLVGYSIIGIMILRKDGRTVARRKVNAAKPRTS